MKISEDMLTEIRSKIKKSEIGKKINDIILDGFSDEEKKYLFDNTNTWSMLTSFAVNELQEFILEDKIEKSFESHMKNK